jgi:prepilin-type N-terminal cleavage/methylation domain-containing protein
MTKSKGEYLRPDKMTKVRFIKAQLRNSSRATRLNASLARRSLARRPATVQRFNAFTLLELLIVLGIIGLLLVLIAPAFTYIKGGTDVTTAAYTIKGVLDTARTYAKANNTYTWVGFFEEDVSQSSTNPATAGVGRVVMSIVASKDGTMLYTLPLTGAFTLDASPNQTALMQVGKLVKIDNVHLKTFAAPTATPPPFDTFDTRPAPTPTAQIGDTTPATPYLTFHYPAGSLSSQYPFTKVVQFSPHGEGVVDNSNYFASGATLAPISEIGVIPTHGVVTPTPSPSPGQYPGNVVAIQFTGLGGDVEIYRR